MSSDFSDIVFVRHVFMTVTVPSVMQRSAWCNRSRKRFSRTYLFRHLNPLNFSGEDGSTTAFLTDEIKASYTRA